LPIDEEGDAGFLGARPKVVSGNKASHRRIEEGNFFRREILIARAYNDIGPVRLTVSMRGEIREVLSALPDTAQAIAKPKSSPAG
jgi:hypothetical protein